MFEEGLDGAGNDAGQSAGWGDKAFVVIAHAFDNLHRLKMADDCADVIFQEHPPNVNRRLAAHADQKSAFELIEVTTFIKWLLEIL